MKTCNSGSQCMHKVISGTSTTLGNQCNYEGYCDYQLPRDSRMQPLYDGMQLACPVCHCIPCICAEKGTGNAGVDTI